MCPFNFKSALLLIIIVLFSYSGLVAAQGGLGRVTPLRFLYNNGGLLLHMFRVNSGLITNNYAGTINVFSGGGNIVSGFCPPGNPDSPFAQRERSSIAANFPATILRAQGGRHHLLFRDSGDQHILSGDTTSLFSLLLQQLMGNQQSYSSISNPFFNSGQSFDVTQHLLENPSELSSSAYLPNQEPLITQPTISLIEADGLPSPVCNIMQPSGDTVCNRSPTGGRGFIQFTPIRGLLGNWHYDGIGFINTSQGFFAFFVVLLRGGSFACRPDDKSSFDHNWKDDNDSDHTGYRGGIGKAVLHSSEFSQSQISY